MFGTTIFGTGKSSISRQDELIALARNWNTHHTAATEARVKVESTLERIDAILVDGESVAVPIGAGLAAILRKANGRVVVWTTDLIIPKDGAA